MVSQIYPLNAAVALSCGQETHLHVPQDAAVSSLPSSHLLISLVLMFVPLLSFYSGLLFFPPAALMMSSAPHESNPSWHLCFDSNHRTHRSQGDYNTPTAQQTDVAAQNWTASLPVWSRVSRYATGELTIPKVQGCSFYSGAFFSSISCLSESEFSS